MRTRNRRFVDVEHRLLHALMMLVLCVACAINSRPAAAASPESTQFASEMARSNAALLRGSQVAQKGSQDPQVREFSARIVADAAEAEAALSAACQRSGIKLPRPPADASALPEQSGSTFDRVYASEVSQQLARIEALLTSASQSDAVDQQLRRFAQQRLPPVRENRKRADELARAQAGVRPTG